MGHNCAFSGCQSGTSRNRTERKRLGLRQLSIFRPKNEEMLEKWKKSLNQNLKMKDFICELHFKLGDIIKEDKTKLKDGTIFTIPRHNYRLKSDAIPVALPFQEQSIEISEVQELACPINVDLKKPISVTKQRPILPKPDPNYPLFNQLINENNVCVSSAKEEYSFTPKTLIDLEQVKLELLKTALPEGWCWLSKTNFLLFIYLNSHNYERKFTVKVTKDLQMTLYTNRRKIIELNGISSLEDIYSQLALISRYKVCEGSGFNEPKYSDNCLEVLTDNGPLFRQRIEARCSECKKLRQKLQHKKYYQKNLSITKSAHIANICNSKCSLLKKKVEKMIEVIKQFQHN